MSAPRRLVVDAFGPAGGADVARLVDATGRVVASVAEPAEPVEVGALRDAAWEAAAGTGAAGIVFAPGWGGVLVLT